MKRGGSRIGQWLLRAAVVAGAAGAATMVLAVAVQSWSPSSAEAFARGTFEGTALDRRGHVRLGPTIETLWGPDTGVVWDVVAGRGRSAFVALSGPARVLRLRPGADPEVWFAASDEAMVTALGAVRGGRGVYFGLSPEGAVFRSGEPGARELVFETGSRFVWSLLVTPDGTLWAGTGSPGRLVRHRGGATETVFEADDDPVRCLAALPSGAIVAGTGARGRVIRFGSDGRPFVLLDASEDEIVALAVAADATVFAIAARTPRRAPAGPPAAPGGRTPGAPEPRDEGARRDAGGASAATTQRPTPQPAAPPGAGGSVYRIEPDGGVRRIWTSEDTTPYDAVPTAEGLLVGTGGAGRIVGLDRDGEGSTLVRFPSNEAAALARAADGTTLVGGTGDARVAALGPRVADEGTYLGEVIDAGGTADWGRMRWEAEVPRDAELRLEARAGNTETPDATWSDWVAPEARVGDVGGRATLPATRWLQIRAILRSSPGGQSPALRRIELFYAPRNQPPRIKRLEVQPVGVAWSKGPSTGQSPRGPLVADDPVARRAARSLTPQGRAPRILKSYEAGARTFVWEADDPDRDTLTFQLEIARVETGDDRWFPLGTKLRDEFLSWDSRGMPDGTYRARITADDAVDNPNGKHLTASRTSEPFRVDNTPPTVAEFEVRTVRGRYEASFVARDPAGRVEAVEFAVDGGDWEALDPIDGVTDSAEERYRLEIDRERRAGAVRHLAVRVTDSAGNLGGDMRRLDGPRAD